MTTSRARIHALLILAAIAICAALAGVLASRADASNSVSSLYFSRGNRLGTVQGTSPSSGLNAYVQDTEFQSEYAWSDGTVTYFSGPDGLSTNATGMDRNGWRRIVSRANAGFVGIEAFAVANGYVYFTRWGGVGGGITSIARVKIDGTELNLNFITGDFQWARGLAAQGDYLYIADENGGKIYRAPLAGGAATVLVEDAGNSPTTVAVDGRYVYWTPRFRNTIARASIDGTNPNLDFITLTAAASQPWGVDVDGTHIYWTTYAWANGGKIGRANIDGTGKDEAWASPGGGITSLNVIPGPARLAPIPAPTSTGIPQMSGTASVGSQLTATSGTWAATPAQVSYQWQVSSDGQNWTSATGTGNATSQYTVANADAGKYLRVRVQASDGGASTTVVSVATSQVPIPAPTNTALPQLSGTPAVGSQLFGTWGSWSASPTGASYQWQGSDDGQTGWADLVTPAGGSLFTPTLAEAGRYLRLRVAVTAGGDWTTVYSAATTRIPVPAPVNAAAPTVSGTAAVGSRLAATTGSWAPTPTQYAYQWEVSADGLTGWGLAPGIGGATASYVADVSDLGRHLRVRVLATTADGLSTAEVSAAAGPVAVALPPELGGAQGALPGVAGQAGACAALAAGRPVGVTINDDAMATNKKVVSIGISAPSCDTTVTVSNNGSFRDARTFPVAAAIPWTLAATRSERLPKTIYVRFGQSSQTFTDDIILDQIAPVLRRATLRRTILRIRATERGSGLASLQASRRARGTSAVSVPLAGKTAVRVRSARDTRWVRVADRAGNWSKWVRVTRR